MTGSEGAIPSESGLPKDGTPTLSVDLVTDLDRVAELRPAWTELEGRSGTRNPFAGPDWTLSWLEYWAAQGKPIRPYVVKVTRGRELVGVIPFWERKSRLRARTLYPTVRGRDWIGPFEISGGVAAAGLGRAVVREVVQTVIRAEPRLAWMRIGLSDTSPWFEPDWLPSDDYAVMVASVIPRVVVPIVPNQAFRPRRNLRESLRRSRNRLTRDFGDDWSTVHIRDSTEFGDALSRLVNLHRERSSLLKGGVHPDILSNPATRAITMRAVTEMAERGAASLFELRAASQVVASQLVLHTKHSSHLSISGQSSYAWEYSAPTLLQFAALEAAQQAGKDTFDLSVGPNTSKLRWSDTIVTSFEYDVVSPRLTARGLYSAETSLSRLAGLRAAIASDRRHAPARGVRRDGGH